MNLSTPGYSCDTMRKFTDVNLKLISDIEKYHFIEKVIWGGISMICHGYVKNDNILLKSYYPTKAKTWIFGRDANNLYRHSVMQALPFKIIDWFDPEKINLEIYSEGSSPTYVFWNTYFKIALKV